MKETYSLGIDVGGTNIKLVLIGNCDDHVPITSSRLTESVLDIRTDFSGALSAAAMEFISENGFYPEQITHIGISVPGRVDYKSKRIIYAYNLGLHDVQVSDGFARYFPTAHIAVMNDADAAAYAEYKRGSMENTKNACLLTLGTGLGAGFIINGELYLGGKMRGTEFGHAVIDICGSYSCTCGETGCAEALCGSLFFKKRTHELYGYDIDAEKIFTLCAQNDNHAKSIVDEYINNLIAVIVTVVNTFDPEVFALGGGIAQALSPFLSYIQEEADKHCFFENAGRIVLARMGMFAGAHGAALWS